MPNPSEAISHLTQSELSVLYNNFTHYRDKYCNGRALMGIVDFYKKYKLGAYK